MTARGWMVVFAAIVFTVILASCAKSSNDDRSDKPQHMSCGEQNAFMSSGVNYVQEGGGLVAYNGAGQRYVLSPREQAVGSIISKCEGANSFYQGDGYGRDSYNRSYEPHQEVYPMGPRETRPREH